MTGSGIFTDKGKVGSESDATTDPKTGLRYYQVAYLCLVLCFNRFRQV